jgi:omega-amidase
MKIRLVQFQPLHDKEKNRATALKLAQSPGLVDTDILVFPELFTTGYQLENIERLAEPLEGETFQHFQALAQEYQVSIVLGSLATRQNTHLYNNTVILSPTGDLLGSYSKIHLFRLMKEEQYFSAGRTLGLFSWFRYGDRFSPSRKMPSKYSVF